MENSKVVRFDVDFSLTLEDKRINLFISQLCFCNMGDADAYTVIFKALVPKKIHRDLKLFDSLSVNSLFLLNRPDYRLGTLSLGMTIKTNELDGYEDITKRFVRFCQAYFGIKDHSPTITVTRYLEVSNRYSFSESLLKFKEEKKSLTIRKIKASDSDYD